MSKENNKMQVDIENLFKQNVNDLLSIKELYKRIEELGEKITQIKYIDNTLVKKIKKEYEKLNKIILDENIQVQLDNKIDEFNLKLTNNIETINSQMYNNTNKIDNRTLVSVKDFGAKGDGKTDDTEYIVNAITYCVENGKNELYVPNGNYIISDTIEIPTDFTLNLGANVKYDWGTTKAAIIKPIENKTAFKLNSKSNIIGGLITTEKCIEYSASCILIDYSDNKQLVNININTTLRGMNSKGTAIEIYTNNVGNGSLFPCYINCNIQSFHTGIYTHKGNGNGSSWFSGLFFDGSIINCVRAINNQFGGNGGKISGSIQPLVGNKSSDEPFILIGGYNIKIDAMVWDLDTAINRKYIQNYGGNNLIISSYNIRPFIEDFTEVNKLKVIEDFLNKYDNLPMSSSNQINPLKSMNGNQDNLLLGGNKRYNIIETKTNTAIGGGGGSLKPDGMWVANGAESYIALIDKTTTGVYSVEIPLDISRGVRAIGATFNLPPSHCKIELYSEKINNYKTVYDNDLKVINGLPIYAFWEYDYIKDYADIGNFAQWNISKIKFTFTLNPDISINCTVSSLFAYDGSINVLGLYGGNVYGDIIHNQNSGTVLQSTNGNKYRLIVSDDGTLSTKKI